jgi:hypothetical protein
VALGFIAPGVASATDLPVVGPFEVPAGWHGVVCRTSVSAGSVLTPTGHVGSDSWVWVNCYIDPLVDGGTTGIRVLSSGRLDAQVLVRASNLDGSSPGSLAVCGQLTSGPASVPGVGGVTGQHQPGAGRISFGCQYNGAFEGKVVSGWGAQISVTLESGDTYGTSGNLLGNTLEAMSPVYWSASPTDPGWPSIWPYGADPVPVAGADVELPELACRSSVRRDADDVIRADFHGVVTNPSAYAVDYEGSWAYEWENDAGQPDTWDTWHAGDQALDVPVPTTGVPAAGWRVVYSTRRIVTLDHRGEFTPTAGLQATGSASHLGGVVVFPGASNMTYKVGQFLGLNNTTDTPLYVMVRDDGDMWPNNLSAWDTAYVYCYLTVKPGRAGTASGDTINNTCLVCSINIGGGDTDPSDGWPDQLPPAGGTGGHSGGDNSGCSADFGGVLSYMNPLNYLKMLGCGLGSFLGDLIPKLLALLRDLFLPDDWSLGDALSGISADMTEKAPGSILFGAAGAIGGAYNGFQGGGEACHGVRFADDSIQPEGFGCNPPDLPLYDVAYRFMQAGLIVATIFGLMAIARKSIES